MNCACLEELHYHSIHNQRYISEISNALRDEGMMDKERIPREIKLKKAFKATDFYKSGVVWINKRVPKSYRYVQSFEDLGVKKKDFSNQIATGQGGVITPLTHEDTPVVYDENARNLAVKDIEKNILKSAVACNPFLRFQPLNDISRN